MNIAPHTNICSSSEGKYCDFTNFLLASCEIIQKKNICSINFYDINIFHFVPILIMGINDKYSINTKWEMKRENFCLSAQHFFLNNFEVSPAALSSAVPSSATTA